MPAASPLDLCTAPHELLIPEDPALEPDFLALPATPGVALFFPRDAASAAPILIAATADLRALARRRICPESVAPDSPAPDESSGASATDPASPLRPFKPPTAAAPRIAYRSIVSRIVALPAGSSLEADAIYLRQARERMPQIYKAVSERWRAWFAHVDPDAEHPLWSKTNLLVGLVGKRSASTLISGSALPPGVLLGPLPDKDSAGRFIERVIDAFDLCRYHHLLVLAPGAQACAYKEMSRCPAPCDGSEGLDAYRARTRAAIRTLAGPALDLAIGDAEAAMRTAAAEGRFEVAGMHKARADRLRTLDAPAFAHVRDLAHWRSLVLLRSPAAGAVRAAVFDRGDLLCLGDFPARDAGAMTSAAQAIIDAARAALSAQPAAIALDTPRIDTIGLYARWLMQPAKRRIGEILDIDPSHDSLGLTPETVAKALKSTLSPRRAAEDQIQEHELESAS